MFLAYFDESGDAGLAGSPTRFFVLTCVLIHEKDWLANLDTLIKARRHLRKKYGISMSKEIKAQDFRSGGGAFRGTGISRQDRHLLFEKIVRWAAEQIEMKIFSVAIEKAGCASKGSESRYEAWRFTLQRVQRFCTAQNERATAFPDAGHGYFIRRLLRKIRRYDSVGSYFGGGALQVKADRVVEDPNERISHESYYIQLADWLSYAAHRSQYVDPKPPFPDAVWDLLGDRLLREVNSVAGGPPGIVYWPRP